MFIIEGCVLLFACIVWIESKLICQNEHETYYQCPKDQECCPEGCCIKNFPIPKVSIALALSVCTLMLILYLLCWCIQIITKICAKFGVRRTRKNDYGKMEMMDDTIDCDSHVPPPRYSVAISIPTVPTTKNAKIPTYEEAVKMTQTHQIL